MAFLIFFTFALAFFSDFLRSFFDLLALAILGSLMLLIINVQPLRPIILDEKIIATFVALLLLTR